MIKVNIRKYAVIVATFVAMAGCVAEETVNADWGADVVGLKDTKYGVVAEIQLTFRKLPQRKFLYDWGVFSKECGDREDKNLIGQCASDLKCILNAINHSQVIVENKQGEMIFFTDFTRSFHERPLRLVNCAARRTREIEVKEDGVVSPVTVRVYISDLKTNENVDAVRFHYLSKPTAEEIRKGYAPSLTTSEWIRI